MLDNSLSLSAKREVALTENTQTVTTKELAEMLGVDVDTVNNVVSKIGFSDVLRKSTGGRPTKAFTEEQATLIKQEIQKHHNLSTRQIDTVTTDYEMMLMTEKVLAYHAQKAAEYKQRMEIAEGTLNRIADGKGCFSINQTAKALKLGYGDKTLFKKLKEMGILNADNTPRQEHVNAERFKVIVKYINEYVGNKKVTLVTSKGLVYLAKRFNTTIDETIQADAE